MSLPFAQWSVHDVKRWINTWTSFHKITQSTISNFQRAVDIHRIDGQRLIHLTRENLQKSGLNKHDVNIVIKRIDALILNTYINYILKSKYNDNPNIKPTPSNHTLHKYTNYIYTHPESKKNILTFTDSKNDECAAIQQQSNSITLKISKDVQALTDKLLNKYKTYNFKNPKNAYKDIQEQKENTKESTMFDSVQKMQSAMDIKNTELERDLKQMERALISKDAKKHISRKCRGKGCDIRAPQNYPNNIYLCDKHKQKLSKDLVFDIDCDSGTEEDKRKCRKLKESYAKFINSVKIPDNQQSFDKEHLYPKNYFTVAMAKLLWFQQQIGNVDTTHFTDQEKKSTKQLEEIGSKLMEILIVGRQYLNDFWQPLFTFILDLISKIGFSNAGDAVGKSGIAIAKAANNLIPTNPYFIYGMYGCVVLLAGLIVCGFIWGDKQQKKAAGCAAIGMVVGGLLGAFGGPGGAAGGALCGGIIASGIGFVVFDND